MRAHLLCALTGLILAYMAFDKASAQQRIMLPPDTQLGIIDTIIIAGNAKTKDYVIRNEMMIQPGDTATIEGIEYDRNRIYSLGLFTRVDIAYDSLQSVRFLFVDVNERWYLLPYPVVGFRDGDPKRFYAGAGLLHNNVGGHNQKLNASIVFGSDPSAAISFRDPLFIPNERLFVSGTLSFNRVRNKSIIEESYTGPYDELHYDVDATVGKRFTLTQSAGITFGFQRLEVSSWWPGRTVSASGRDQFLFAQLSYSFDSRDLFEYPSRGSLLSAYVVKIGLWKSSVNYARFGVDARRYVAMPLEFTLALRVQGSVAWGGEVPTYGHTYFGYGERLRGWFKTVFEGEDITSTTVELRHIILTPRVVRLSAAPIPDEFSIWRFGVSAAIFANAGVTWYRGDMLTWSSFNSGYGAGIHFLLPYSFVVRTEYAWNQFHKGEFILNLQSNL